MKIDKFSICERTTTDGITTIPEWWIEDDHHWIAAKSTDKNLAQQICAMLNNNYSRK